METANRYIDTHFRKNPSLREISAAVGLSSCYFHQVYAKVTGETPKDRINRLRMDEAKRMLLDGARAGEVAKALRFSSLTYFYLVFKQRVGVGPERWARTHVKSQ